MPIKPGPRMNNAMHTTTHSISSGLSLAVGVREQQRMMRAHTSATGM